MLLESIDNTDDTSYCILDALGSRFNGTVTAQGMGEVGDVDTQLYDLLFTLVCIQDPMLFSTSSPCCSSYCTVLSRSAKSV
jgi:hypothetical protein